MAQIIKHRRGSLESLSGATKRAGELLVVTGSSGITASNGDSILFIGIDGSTVTPANKVLQGTSVPNLSGADYDTSIDGIPFYDTSAEKLFLLNKGGNVEIKATANTGGTGIVSGSSQVTALLPVGTVSGSVQVTISETTGFTDFSSSVATDFSASNADLTALSASVSSVTGEFSSSVATTFSNVEASQSVQNGRLTALEVESGSIESEQSVQDGRLTALESFSSSLGDSFATDSELAAVSTSFDTTIKALDTDDIAEGSNLYFTDARVKTKLNAETVVSGSSQVTISQTTGFTDFSSSLTTKDTELFATASDHEGRIDAIEEAIGNGSDIDTRLSSLETFSGSAELDLTELFATASDHEGRVDILEASQSAFDTAIALDGQNVTITGNLTVQGTTTTIDSTTVNIGDNIVQLNGTGAAFGGLIIVDTTAPNQVSGSLLWDATNDYWIAGASGSESKLLREDGDSVISGSSQVNADSITNFDENVKAKLDVETVISGSSQVNADSITNFDENVKAKLDVETVISGSSQVNADSITNFDENVKAKLDADTVISGSSQVNADSVTNFDTNVKDKLDADGVISGSSQVNADSITNFDENVKAKLDVETVISGSSQVQIDSVSGFTSFSSSVDSRVDALEAFSSALDAGFVTEAELASATGALETADTAQQARLTSLEGFSSSIDTTIKTKLNLDAVVSSSAQIVTLLSDQATDFGTGRVSADSIGNVDGSSTITGSFVGDGSGLSGLVTTLQLTGSNGSTSTVDLLTQGLSFASASGQGLGIAVAGQTLTFSNENASTSAKGVASFGSTNFSVTSGDVSIKSGGVPAAALAADVAGTGISLNGGDNSIEVDYGSTTGTAVEGNTSLTVQGTANEIEISGGSVTLGAGGTVTIGLPDSVTIATASIQNNLSVGGDVTITGNLSVLGTTTTIDSTTVQIGDNVIELNYGGAQSTAGLLVTDSTAPNTVSGSFLWNGTSDFWMGGALGSEKEFARLNTDPTTNRVIKVNSDGLLVDSLIEDDGTNVIITGTAELRINSATANSFVYFGANKELDSVTPITAGDVIQWNGSSFIASNELDGGTF